MFGSPLTFTSDLSYGTLEENAENTKNISGDILYAIHDVSGQQRKFNLTKKYDPKTFLIQPKNILTRRFRILAI
jgi:hypothetical protein